MSDKPEPKPSFSSLRSTLRRLANEDDPAERQRVADLFASQIEIALDSQGSNMQFALWNVEESFGQKFDALNHYISDSNTLQAAVLSAVQGVQTGQEGMKAAIEEIARGLGKTQQEVEGLKGIVSDLGEDQSQLRTDVGILKNDMSALKHEVGDVKTRVGRIETIVRKLAEESGATKATREMLKRWEANNPPPEDDRA